MEKKKISAIKIINSVFGIAVIICIIVNVRLFNDNNTLNNETVVTENNGGTLQTEKDTVNTNLESEKGSLSDLSTQTDTLNEELETLETDNQNLSDSLSEVEK